MQKISSVFIRDNMRWTSCMHWDISESRSESGGSGTEECSASGLLEMNRG